MGLRTKSFCAKSVEAMAPLPEELVHPLTVVDTLFATSVEGGRKPNSQWGERDHFNRALNLDDEASLAKIPCINGGAAVTQIPPFSLVRYRGLVQDVFEPELYTAVLKASDHAGSQRFLTTKYRECLEHAPGREVTELGRDGLSSRGACYCVPLPCETPWARATSSTQAVSTIAGVSLEFRSQKVKRSRMEEDVDMGVGAPVVESKRLHAVSRRTAHEPAVGTSDAFGLNFPIPSEQRREGGMAVPCIVKLYDDDADSLRVCETVEVIGVFCVDPELASFDDWNDARHPSTSLVPRIHALSIRRLPFFHPELPFSTAWLTEARLAAAWQEQFATQEVLHVRVAAVAALAKPLAGDVLAAEYVLMLLTSRAFGKHGDQSLGPFPLNLAMWPETLPVTGLVAALEEMVPRVAHLVVAVDTLNAKRWRPTKDFDANRLVAGQLQLAAGTTVVFDETQMKEGDLDPQGVKAMAAVTELAVEQQLVCDFASFDVRIPLEVQSISVSSRRSIIRDIDVQLPMRCGVTGDEDVVVPDDALHSVRMFLGLVTRSPSAVDMPEDVVERFCQDFTEIRKRDVRSELGHAWMNLARAFCFSYGERSLTLERWTALVALEHERLQRCEEAFA